MSPALEALLLPFSKGGLTVPKRVLFLGAEVHPDLKAWPEVTGWQPHKGLAMTWEGSGFKRIDEPTGTWPLVMMLPGKSKDETLAQFAQAYDLLEDGGILLASMTNLGGAERFEKELKKAAGTVESLQKHKCRTFHAVKSSAWDQELLAKWREAGKVRLIPDTTFLVQPGLFSPDHLDPGSKLLVEHLPNSLRGAVADLGGGWGYLTRWVADHCPNVKRIDLHEVDARAIALARENLKDSPVEVAFHWHDVSKGLPHTYDAVVMNPPFHSGQNTDIDLGVAFVRNAAASLKQGGRLYLVANRKLPYERQLDAAQLTWRKVAEDGTYKVLFGERTLK